MSRNPVFLTEQLLSEREHRMNAREKGKQATRQNILKIAKEEFIEKGLFGLSTATVAQKAGIAHGTVFYHFATKEDLMYEMLDSALLKITAQLNNLLKGRQDTRSLLDHYLDFVTVEEPFLAMIAKETGLYPAKIRRVVMGREAAIRLYFYRSLTHEMEMGVCKVMDPGMVLSFLFATINEFLSKRDAYRIGDRVIAKKKEMILNTFFQFISA
ncbi:MAG: TetR/AcrR family transcriptional regulator [Anaerolineaceae bacterium]|nr:TetR/AcrR family transcriptional regulator [Anaerolineaceae bacterium]